MADSDIPSRMPDAELTLSDAADARAVARFRNVFSQWLRTNFALNPTKLSDVLLAVNEALTNSAEFAYAGTKLAKSAQTVTMQARYEGATHALWVDVTDSGTWRTVDTESDSTRGRGIPLMKALADRLTISAQPTGTRVRMQFSDCARVSAQRHVTPA